MPTVNKPIRPWMKGNTKSKSRWANETHGGVPNQFYRNAPWRRFRARWLAAHPLCQHCFDKKRLTPATVVDHVRPIRLGGEPLDENNAMSLCKSCHARKSGAERHQ